MAHIFRIRCVLIVRTTQWQHHFSHSQNVSFLCLDHVNQIDLNFGALLLKSFPILWAAYLSVTHHPRKTKHCHFWCEGHCKATFSLKSRNLLNFQFHASSDHPFTNNASPANSSALTSSSLIFDFPPLPWCLKSMWNWSTRVFVGSYNVNASCRMQEWLWLDRQMYICIAPKTLLF